jgi:hypothetical protein
VNTEANARETLFWELAEQLLAEPGVTRSAMMGYPCLRANGAFFACVERTTGHLIVKLPALRVDELVATGQALPFAPNGRTFREWAAFPVAEPDEWSGLLAEARSFVEAETTRRKRAAKAQTHIMASAPRGAGSVPR